ncbi:hypothetical protein [Lysinibacillus fusiformis]|uniref:hypothetical protein n=1 Tax=Lysinibacillus fusiformis TaxID=28031 RepID=UPI0037FC1D0F
MATLTKECGYKIDNIGWFSDRDSLTIWMDGLINDLAFVCYDGICKTEKIDDNSATSFNIGAEEKTSKILWYDELNRIPDFLTGALAGRNYASETPDKYDTIFEQAICSNNNLAVIYCFEQDNGVNSDRCTFIPN